MSRLGLLPPLSMVLMSVRLRRHRGHRSSGLVGGALRNVHAMTTSEATHTHTRTLSVTHTHTLSGTPANTSTRIPSHLVRGYLSPVKWSRSMPIWCQIIQWKTVSDRFRYKIELVNRANTAIYTISTEPSHTANEIEWFYRAFDIAFHLVSCCVSIHTHVHLSDWIWNWAALTLLRR